MVPSEVICGVTSSSSTASTNWTETVLFTMVGTWILVPCLTMDFWLFWATIFGLEMSLPTPRSSAAVMIMSSAKLALANEYAKPLVGVAAPKLVSNGADPDVSGGVPTANGGAGL